MMTNRQVRKFNIDKEHTDHPITDRLQVTLNNPKMIPNDTKRYQSILYF